MMFLLRRDAARASLPRVQALLAATALALAGCATHRPPPAPPFVLPPLPPLTSDNGVATTRVSGEVEARQVWSRACRVRRGWSKAAR